MVRHLDGKSGKLGIIGKVRNFGLQQRHDNLLEGFLEAGIRVHEFRRIRCIVIAGNLQHALALVEVEADGALIGSLHLGEVDVEDPAEIERVGKLVGLNFLSDGHQGLEVALLEVLRRWIRQLHRSDHLRRQKERCSQQHKYDGNSLNRLHYSSFFFCINAVKHRSLLSLHQRAGFVGRTANGADISHQRSYVALGNGELRFGLAAGKPPKDKCSQQSDGTG